MAKNKSEFFSWCCPKCGRQAVTELAGPSGSSLGIRCLYCHWIPLPNEKLPTPIIKKEIKK